MSERWLPVVDWEGLYEVSDRGRIRSLPRATASGVRGGQLLKGFRSRGYMIVRLRGDGRIENRSIHSLVLAAFVGPCPDGEECRHGPGGRLDNRWPENLSYGTRSENYGDKVRDGTHNRGERNANAKITDADAREVLRKAAGGARKADLAREFGLTREHVYRIVRRECWRFV